jgi:hypothetical protein
MRGMNNINCVNIVPIGQKIREMYLENIIPLQLYLSSITRIFLKLRMLHFHDMRYKACKHGFDRFTKYLSAVSPLRLNGFPSNSTPRTYRACVTNGVSLRSVNYRLNLLGEQRNSSTLSRVPLEGFYWNFTPCTFHTSSANCASLVGFGQ